MAKEINRRSEGIAYFAYAFCIDWFFFFKFKFSSLATHVLSALNGELFFIVLEPVSLNNSIDYEELQSYNISADCKKSTERKPSLARGPTLAYHVILLNIYCKEQANIIKEIYEQKKARSFCRKMSVNFEIVVLYPIF